MTAPRERFGDEATERPTESVPTSELLLAIGAYFAGIAGLFSWSAWLLDHSAEALPAGLWRRDLMITVAGLGAAQVLLYQRGSRTWRYGVGAVCVALAGALTMAVAP